MPVWGEMLCICQDRTIADAFLCLETNSLGAVVVTDGNGRVVGIATDGDIRRNLLQHNDTQQLIGDCMNTDFVSVRQDTPREQVLKLLDHRIEVIPVLDAEGRLVDLYSKKLFPLEAEKVVYARARSPVRISFGGGGTDLTHYFVDNGGVVINATISKFSHAALRKREDSRIHIQSLDLNTEVEVTHADDLRFDGRLDLVKAIVKLINPPYGFDLEIMSEFPVGSGLGGSAVVAAAVIGCFNEFRADRWDRYRISEIAFQAERLQLEIAGGWQDQYATVFGGFNFMEFSSAHNVIMPLRLEQHVVRELEESLILCYTGKSHDSGAIHRDQRARMTDTSGAEARAAAEGQKQLTVEMKNLLLRGRLPEYGRLLHQAWELKRQYSPLISGSDLDAIYELARANGAIGGKLLGAGGGGYFLFYVQPFLRFRLITALRAAGLQTEPITFDESGLQSWTMRAEI